MRDKEYLKYFSEKFGKNIMLSVNQKMYEKILENSKLLEKLEDKDKQISELKTEITRLRYLPNGEGYYEALEDYELCLSNQISSS
jgi:predicted nuclease with TOPRIM domain